MAYFDGTGALHCRLGDPSEHARCLGLQPACPVAWGSSPPPGVVGGQLSRGPRQSSSCTVRRPKPGPWSPRVLQDQVDPSGGHATAKAGVGNHAWGKTVVGSATQRHHGGLLDFGVAWEFFPHTSHFPLLILKTNKQNSAWVFPKPWGFFCKPCSQESHWVRIGSSGSPRTPPPPNNSKEIPQSSA